MNKKIALCILLIFSLMIPVQAKTKSELIQEALLNGQAPDEMTPPVSVAESVSEVALATSETQSNTTNLENTDAAENTNTTENENTENEGQETESVYEAPIDFNIPFDEIDKRIEAINQRKPDPVEVKSLRASFEMLDTAQKMKIKNLTLLIKAEEAIASQEASTVNTPTPKKQETKGNVMGSEYTFWIGKDATQLSLIARMVTDDNKDGIGEKPEFTLSGPSGSTITFFAQSQTIEDNTMSIECTMTDSYFQIDIAKLLDGDWTLTSSIPVVFERHEYLGASKIEPETKEEAQNSKDSKIRINYWPAIKACLMIILTAGGLLGFLFGVQYFFASDEERKKSPIKNIGKAIKPKIKEQEEPVNHKKADEEMIEQIRREMEEERRRSEAMDEEVYEAKEDDKEENRMDITAIDYEEEEEDNNEEFVQHVGDTGILSKKEKEPKKKQFGGRFG